MVGIFSHLGCEVNVGASKVSHCRPFLHCCLVEVVNCLLYTNQVVTSVAALTRFLLLLSGVGLVFDEVGLEGCPVFVFLRPPLPKIFRVLYRFSNKSVHNAEEMGLCACLTQFRYKVGALIESLDETFEWILHIVTGTELLFILQHVSDGDVDVMIVQVIG